MEVLDLPTTDAVLVAGGDGTLLEVLYCIANKAVKGDSHTVKCILA